MRPYNFKVWAHPPELMNKQWIGERVAVIDFERALKNLVMGTDDFAWGPNNQFKFPLKGGTGEFYKRFGPVLEGLYSLCAEAMQIDLHRKEILFKDGDIVKYDKLISAMPLDKLCKNMLLGEVP